MCGGFFGNQCGFAKPLEIGILGSHVDYAIHLAGTQRPTVVTKMNLTLSADNRVFDSDIGGMTKPDMSLV